ncbi:MAG: hypothetical protein LIO95_02915 [Clostridiales bacterium]|nr:hypothetical protein [Clostridiales bacterium]
MNSLRVWFPLSNTVHYKDTVSLVISIVLYLIVWVVARFLLGAAASLLSFLPLIWTLYRLLLLVVRLYCIVGIVFAVLNYLGKSY